MSHELANLLFPSARRMDEIMAQYPARQLPQGALVTRFAPSPTGFVHIGSIYVALIDWLLSHQSDGVFILRIEDTDQKRKVENGIEDIVRYLHQFGLKPGEGPNTIGTLEEHGSYGPYLQSQRRLIYYAAAKELVARGWAYPSFQTEEELLALRQRQELAGAGPGYYGPWAEDRRLTLAQVKEKLDAGTSFVVRFRAPYPNDEKVTIVDAIRGHIEIPGNDIDHVLLKSDGLPTYHLAVVVDDVLMGVNLVVRGEEWLGTLPLHLQLYNAFDLRQPTFAHIAHIGKAEGNTRRKLSKRRDPEANVEYYFERGYPAQAILEYLLNIADSGFSDWRTANPARSFSDYRLVPKRMPVSLAMYDLQKLNSISREVIATYSADELFEYLFAWAEQYAPHVAQWIHSDPLYARSAVNVGRDDTPPRKDLTVWSDVEQEHGFFFDEYYAQSVTEHGYTFPGLATADILLIVDHCLRDAVSLEHKGKDAWLQDMRLFAVENGFALTVREYKDHPGQYKGTFGQVMEVYRIALTNKSHTPDLYSVIKIMGAKRASARLNRARMWLDMVVAT